MKTNLFLHIPSDEEMKLVQKYIHLDYDKKELYICRIKIADNDVDDDGNKFSIALLDQIVEAVKGNQIAFKQYDVINSPINRFTMRIISAFASCVAGRVTKDNQPLVEVYADAYVPRKCFDERLMKQIEDRLRGEVSTILTYGNSREEYFQQRVIKTISNLSKIYDLEIEYPCKDDRNYNENILKDNSMKSNSAKDCSGCMGAAFGDCAECDERTSTTSSTSSTTMSEDVSEPSFNANQIKTKEIAKLVVPVSAVLEPITVIRGSDTALLRLTKAEINDIIDFIECNFKNDLLDSEWDGNINYPACIIGLYQKFKKAKDYIEKNIGGDNDEKS